MLSLLRRFSKSPIGIGVFALILIAFVVTLYEGKSAFGGGVVGGGDTVVTVAGQDIGEAELQRRVQNQLEGERRQNPAIDMSSYIATGGVEKTVDLAATGRALEVFAEKQGMVTSKTLVDGAIASIPAFNGPTGKFDEATYRSVLAQRKISEAMLRSDFAREALTRILAVPASGGTRVPAAMVLPYASLFMESRKGAIAEVPSAAFRATAVPTDAELQTFYQRNIARYTVPERRVIRYAAFDKSRFAGKVDATEAEIAKVYADNQATYGAREKRAFTQIITSTDAQAKQVMDRIKSGASMADAAKLVQRDALVVQSTDAAGFEKLSGPSVARAAFAVPKGAFAAIERSGLGYHVVRVDSITTIPATPLSAVRAKIAADLTAQKQTKAIGSMLGEVEDAIGNKATFDEVAKKYGLAVQATPALTSGGIAFDAPGYQPPAEVRAALGEAFQVEVGDDPAVAPLPGNAGYVLWKLDRIIAAAPKPLAALRTQVIADLQIYNGSKAAKLAADAIVAAVNSGTPLAQAMAKAGVPLPAPQPAGGRRIDLARAQGKVPPPLALMFAIPEKRARVLENSGRQGWYIVYVDKIDSGDARTVPGLVEATQQQLSGVIGDEYVQQFANAIAKSVGVTKNAAGVARLKKSLVGGGTQ